MKFYLYFQMIILVVSMLVVASVRADTMQHATTAAMVVDWGQTLDIEHHPGYVETNRHIGPHPSRAAINAYFASKLAFHYWINKNHKFYAKVWNGAQLLITLEAITGNYKLGLKVNF